jgi:O-antigen ligase
MAGMFDDVIGHYVERGGDETGRFAAWPVAIGRFLDNPLAGVGAEDLGTYVPVLRQEITPHNGFIYIGLASGIIPLGLFVVYWLGAIRSGYYLTLKGLQNPSFQLPLLIYTFIVGFSLSGVFMYPWAVVTLCNAMPRRGSRIIPVRIRHARAVDGSAEQPIENYKLATHRSNTHA